MNVSICNHFHKKGCLSFIKRIILNKNAITVYKGTYYTRCSYETTERIGNIPIIGLLVRDINS